MNPNNNNQNFNKNNNNGKMPKFGLGWIYILALVGLLVAYLMGNNSVGGSAGKPASYTKFQTYLMQGYAQSIVVNKDNSLDDTSTDSIKGIYTGEITSWGDVK